MAKLISVRIKNFKGIDNILLTVEGGKSPGRFVTLVGLNESGKTSIIEAIALSVLQDPDTADLLTATSTNIDMHDVVPKHHSAGFTGNFEIDVTIDFSDSPDYTSSVTKIIKEAGFVVDGAIHSTITITKSYSFEDSNYKSSSFTWSFTPRVKKPTGIKVSPLHDVSRQTWVKCLSHIKTLIPRSVYFPTFLVNFPKRVYLEGDYGAVDNYYRSIVKDALNGLSAPLNIDKHIIDRVNKHRTPGETFSSALRSSNEGRQIDATVQALAAELNFVVFGAWGEIFKKPIKNRQIVIEWHLDESQDNHVYLEFYIIAGDHRFYISERSVGFRWFFSFLLFTQFQGARSDGRKIIFLFDEPASHLHPKAQERLLTSFQKIADPNHVIIYSTHSHYLINPLWLEQAYIVSNSAIDSEGDETGISRVDARVKIIAEKYKAFVSSHPSKTTYYQPILDVLDQSSSGLDIAGRVIILEGKYDYYPFQYLVKQHNKGADFRVLPAVGAGGLSALVSIMRGWDMKFIVLLDDDDAGRKEKAKYKDVLMLSDNQVVTLDEINSTLKGKEFEGIFQEDVRSAVRNSGFSSGNKIYKEQYYTFFQAIQSGLATPSPMPQTDSLFLDILKEIERRLALQ
ncbi:hypothetical protein EWE75_12160 [Sphingomonas populi]|uniref:Endonuclease GajA/Old nuclease/RecF-like AAA domain-containing protein n=1 Tax=Sphingomonas populi TaxID=2484750 RepID=A0A4Q6XUM6_9SPHN|nr:AAA family ATPase [Sphingomonas populi]RZF64293.1 hypothetical protein EWE75_12160 [Sphingomonas populi]